MTTLKGPDLKILAPRVGLGQFFFDQADKFAENICQIDGTTGQTETYKSFKLRAVKAALELKSRGVTAQDFVLLCCGNTLDSAVPYVGAALLGAKIGALDPSLSVAHTRHLISLVAPKVIFVEDGAAVRLIEDSLDGGYAGGGGGSDGTSAGLEVDVVVFGRSKTHSEFAEFQKDSEQADAFRPAEVDVKDTALVYFSSGTTGLPKGICYHHHGALQVPFITLELGISSKAVLHFTTLYWGSAVFMLITSFAEGGYRVLCPKFDPKMALELIENYKVTYTFLSPSLLYGLTDFVTTTPEAKFDTSSVQTCLIGGGRVSKAKMDVAKDLFKNSALNVAYGQTEVGFIAAFAPGVDRDLILTKEGSCGKAVPGLRLKVVDVDSRKPLGVEENGEILVKTDVRMKGFLKVDFPAGLVDDEGFLATGDVGYYDKDGCVYVVDRIKEMFKYKSWHIVPSSLEVVLLSHAGVKEAAIFGVPHETDGDLPAAAVVLRHGSGCDAEEIDEFYAGRVLDREKLRGGIWIVDELAKTPSGKLIRKQIRDSMVKTKPSFVGTYA